MIFSELYSAYYNAVAQILRAAVDHPLGKGEIRSIVEEYAFGESILNIEPALSEERWQLLLPDGTTPIRRAPTMPMTTLQRRWLKAIAMDPRIRLFQEDAGDYKEAESSFREDAGDYKEAESSFREDAGGYKNAESSFREDAGGYEGADPQFGEKSEDFGDGKPAFEDECGDLQDVEPLFGPEDFRIFDQYSDGDDYTDETYIANFRLILDAIKNQYPLSIDIDNRKGRVVHLEVLPKYLEYSEKDDKFRLFGLGRRMGGTINLGRITRCERCAEEGAASFSRRVPPKTRSVVFELVDERNALERALLHFAHFEKQAERLEGNRYRVTVNYNKDDETEMVIRILSFGPMIKVTAPGHFVDLIKKRLRSQKGCLRG